ncbi:Glyco transf 10 domain containing protein [Asbolus verrucosus]|uniref:Fucosyltransferase n=1 Tax=Asbolus verrucosus TaxID=1661398 RepID=A0A482VH44_ASBVE|nr:Glyco transf 10 domain containing protein [Asbolus verrucosus]
MLLITSCLLLSQYKVNETPQKAEEFKETSDWNKTMKTILYWTPMFRQPDFYLGVGSHNFENCTYKNCYTTYHKEFLPVDRFDAIIFHGIQYTEASFGKPAKRRPNQMYIFFCQESPVHTPDFIKNHKNFYNWTMTYRRDSDIMRPYGFIQKRKTDYQPPSVEEIRKRPKKIAWMVSNCGTSSERELLYNALKKVIPIDVYGTCGDLSCPRSTGEKCYDMVEDNYKFYLSFENSICEDYVTEKLFSILKRNIVPIVYGGADYKRIAPPNSVINVMDFKSVKSLVRYIRHLDTHPEEYLKFFEWKKNYIVDTDKENTLCTLCQKLNEQIKPKIYNNIAEWWQGKNSPKCSDTSFISKFS